MVVKPWFFQVKENVKNMKDQVAKDIWKMTNELEYLKEDEWKQKVEGKMKDFEMKLLKAMRYVIKE